MAPSVVWGFGVGLIIALVDAVAIFLTARSNPTEWPIGDVDMLLNVVLYALIGFRVGKATGLIRDAAEGAVLAGFVVSAIGVLFLWLLKPAVGGIETPWDVIGIVSQNIAIGGVLGTIMGWLGVRSGQDSASARR